MAMWFAQWKQVLRRLGRAPMFTALTLLTLAIGIGANCAAFSWADALLLRPLPVPRPSEMVTVGSTMAIQGALANLLRASYPEYTAIRDRTKSFAGLLAYNSFSGGLAPARVRFPNSRRHFLTKQAAPPSCSSDDGRTALSAPPAASAVWPRCKAGHVCTNASIVAGKPQSPPARRCIAPNCR